MSKGSIRSTKKSLESVLKKVSYSSRQMGEIVYPPSAAARFRYLRGAVIRVYLPNVGPVRAVVGRYRPQTNQVELFHITSERTGMNYGKFRFYPEQLVGLQVLLPPPGAITPIPGAYY